MVKLGQRAGLESSDYVFILGVFLNIAPHDSDKKIRTRVLYIDLSLCLYLVVQSFLTLCNPMDCSPPGPSVHGDSPGKNIGAGCHALLQGIFSAQG